MESEASGKKTEDTLDSLIIIGGFVLGAGSIIIFGFIDHQRKFVGSIDPWGIEVLLFAIILCIIGAFMIWGIPAILGKELGKDGKWKK